MRHSGAVSDASFLDLVELELLSSSSREACGILLYARYRDDGLVNLKGPRFCPVFEQKFCMLAAPMDP